MRAARLILACVIPLALAAGLAGIGLVRPPRVSASLYELIGAEAGRIPTFLRETSASEVALVVSSPDRANARAAAKVLADEFPASNDLPPGALDFIRENRAGLVTRETASLLKTRDGRAKIARRAVRRLYASPLPPLLGYEDDPFGLTDAWILSLASARTAKTPEGWPCLETNGLTRILLKHRLDPEVARNLDATIAFLGRLEATTRRLETGDVEVRFAGAPVHAAASARTSKGEIGHLTWFSLAFIAGLSLVVFRSVRWIPLLAGSLAVAALAGGLALVAFFCEIHVMTFVMGTTVLGLVIDYSFHWLLSPAADKPLVRKNLFASFLTTEISLVPLMLATIPVLRQSAVFLGVGLAAALAYVLLAYPVGEGVRRSGTEDRRRPRRPILHSLSSVICVFLLLGLVRLDVRTDVTALYRPSAALVEGERQRAQFSEFDWSALPSLDERRENAARVRELYGEQAAGMMEALGVRSLSVPLEPTDRLTRPQALMDEIFGAWTSESLKRLGLSVLALIAVVACFFRGRSVRILAPSLLALLSVAGVLGWMGTPVNLFHVLAAFLLLGMGVDYAVFLQSGGRGVLRPALSSLLTSVAGFGALAFVSFPVVASFGIVLGFGLPIAFLLALAVRRGAEPTPTEHGASPLGLEILWAFYRLFGLRALHLFAGAVGLCVWAFSPSVRRASPSVRKLIFFTRSLADKFVVMAEGRRLPEVVTDGSDDAASFVADVRGGKGVFVLSSHVGTIEVLTALGACGCTFHAWMDFDRTGVFNRFYLRHAKRPRVVIHPISGFGIATVFEAGDRIDSGDCLVMAGDRGEGAFRFAAAFDHPVYFVACLAEPGCRYRAVIQRLPADRVAMRAAYGSIRARLAESFPDQLFDWKA